jgi:Protein of unknown function (DUF4079)
MGLVDWLRILHPVVAIGVVYPLVGIVVRYALQTRQRRIATKAGKSAIPPTVGAEHVSLGRWLAGAVFGVALLGLGYSIFVKKSLWMVDPGKATIVTLMLGATIGVFGLLYRARTRGWRLLLALLSIGGLVSLGLQDGVFRRTNEWWVSHYYAGMTAAILMVVSVAILPEIYRHLNWRRVHIGLNTIALLLFLMQGVTGTRDLLEIPLSWQAPTIYGCDFVNRVCPPTLK